MSARLAMPVHPTRPRMRFCAFCGTRLPPLAAEAAGGAGVLCTACGQTTQSPAAAGPEVLVLTYVLARGHLLLIQRGSNPYAGQWAPPGGFVEHGESLEQAAVREIWEETRLQVDRTQLLPVAVASLPAINQVYCMFAARLDEVLPATAVPPEALAAGWFRQSELRSVGLWEPASSTDTAALFAGAEAGCFDFHQLADGFSRVIINRAALAYRTRED